MNRPSLEMNAHLPNGDSLAYSVIFASSFLILLCVAIAARLLTRRWRTWLPLVANEKSMISGVKAAVYSFMPLLT